MMQKNDPAAKSSGAAFSATPQRSVGSSGTKRLMTL
jgi:hypothetical protein